MSKTNNKSAFVSIAVNIAVAAGFTVGMALYLAWLYWYFGSVIDVLYTALQLIAIIILPITLIAFILLTAVLGFNTARKLWRLVPDLAEAKSRHEEDVIDAE